MTKPIPNSNQLTATQIAASRDRLISEGFTPVSKAIRVHDQLLVLMAAHEVNTNGAVQSIKELQTECERLREVYEAARGLCFGYDWNHGIHAVEHGYRNKLLAAVNAIEPVPDLKGKTRMTVAESEGA